MYVHCDAFVLFFQSKHTGVCGKIKDQARQKGEEHARDDDVNDEVQGEPQQEEVVGDV